MAEQRFARATQLMSTAPPIHRAAGSPLVNAGVVIMLLWSACCASASTQVQTSYGVWAYRIGPGDWLPCNIQYVGSARPSRYDHNPNYRLVRTERSKGAVDAAISQFSKYHSDQPDQVVKLAPCNPATVLVVTPIPSSHSDPIVGTWRWFNGSAVTFYANGQVSGGGGHAASWVRRGGAYTVTWDFGDNTVGHYVDTLVMSPDGKSLRGKNNENFTVSGSR